MGNIDILVQTYISSIRSAGLTEFLYLITTLFDFSVHFALIAVAIALLIYIVRGLWHALIFLSSIVVGAGFVYVLKIIFNVSRPLDGVIEVFGKSFPSGHATVSTIFFVMLMYIFDDYLPHIKRVIFNLFCTSLIFLVAISRVYLGVHWVSDVSFGILLGCFVSFGFIFTFGRIGGTK